MQSSAAGGVCSKTEFLSQRFERLETCGLQVGLPPFCPLSFHFWFIFRFLFLFRSSSSLSSSNFLFLSHVLTYLLIFLSFFLFLFFFTYFPLIFPLSQLPPPAIHPTSGLYPQLAISDDCNSYRKDSDQVFHTKVGEQ